MFLKFMSFVLFIVVAVSALPDGWERDGLWDYTIIQEDSDPASPASGLKVDECSDVGTSYWYGSYFLSQRSSQTVTWKFDKPANGYYNNITIMEILLRNANCGWDNPCGVQNFLIQVPQLLSPLDTTTYTYPANDEDALNWNWRTIISGALPDDSYASCDDRPYYRYPVDYYPSFGLEDGLTTYARLMVTSWYGDNPALEFLGFSTENVV